MVPPEVFNAALEGDLDAIENWLGEGGNPNAALEYIESDDDFASLDDDLPSTLLMAAASEGHLDLVRRLALLRVRSLLARGRARHGPETTVVAARLFGSLNGFADVPNGIFWLVVEYAWLGDWRHP